MTEPTNLPIELALIRWSVVHRKWHEMGGDCPYLPAFLAGWMCRAIGAEEPSNLPHFRASFRVGWKEANEQAEINSRSTGIQMNSMPCDDCPSRENCDCADDEYNFNAVAGIDCLAAK